MSTTCSVLGGVGNSCVSMAARQSTRALLGATAAPECLGIKILLFFFFLIWLVGSGRISVVFFLLESLHSMAFRAQLAGGSHVLCCWICLLWCTGLGTGRRWDRRERSLAGEGGNRCKSPKIEVFVGLAEGSSLVSYTSKVHNNVSNLLLKL